MNTNPNKSFDIVMMTFIFAIITVFCMYILAQYTFGHIGEQNDINQYLLEVSNESD